MPVDGAEVPVDTPADGDLSGVVGDEHETPEADVAVEDGTADGDASGEDVSVEDGVADDSADEYTDVTAVDDVADETYADTTSPAGAAAPSGTGVGASGNNDTITPFLGSASLVSSPMATVGGLAALAAFVLA